MMMIRMISQFNGILTPNRSCSAKTGVNYPMSLNIVHQKRMLWSNECKVQGKMLSHILKKSPIALTYSRIIEGVTESKRSAELCMRKYSLKYVRRMWSCGLLKKYGQEIKLDSTISNKLSKENIELPDVN